ncbi:MAG TPA: hypothetical protein VHR45_14815 [Thermoanaerobaculia bacterium]|nr:hypothetical protein [Thermoanaerobaculia bacterium]
MPLRRAADPPHPPAAPPDPLTGRPIPPTSPLAPTSPTALASPTVGSAAPPPPPPASPAASPPRPPASDLRTAARELAQAAERTDRLAREILARAHSITVALDRSLALSVRRRRLDAASTIAIAMLLSACAAALGTLLTLAALFPRIGLSGLLRLLLHRG